MAKDRLDQYRGALTPQQIAEGMNAAESNADRLFRDAELLLHERRFPSATALAILAIEEAGKNTILRQLATAPNEAGIKKAWKDYRSHKEKNLASIVPQLVQAGARKIDDFRPAFDGTGDHPAEIDMVKQIALYTDCLGNARWTEPTALIDEGLATQLVGAARILARKKDGYKHSAREVELWIEHIAPVIDQPLDVMKVALAAWFTAMSREGLTDAEPSSIYEFIGAEEKG